MASDCLSKLTAHDEWALFGHAGCFFQLTFWFAIAAMFAGLFGWAYADRDDACKGKALYLTTTPNCLEVRDGGVFANENPCANECDAQLHKNHCGQARGQFSSQTRFVQGVSLKWRRAEFGSSSSV